ncbi:MAG: class I SAM-dependent methyltransferase [Anaerolineaceae bacterium]|nr:class I SAM-dependent methyltransferase [Anaerolineaceae bacterium]
MESLVYEPPPLEIKLTLALGLTILSPYYQHFARGLNLKGDETVMDFGSGSGVCSRHIAARLRNGGNLVCVDISKGWNTVIKNTLKLYNNVDFFLGSINRLDRQESSFDLIVIHFVLHDIPRSDRTGVLTDLARFLKPEGSIIIREPQKHGLTINEMELMAEHAHLVPISIKAHRIAFLPVLDFHYIKTKEK